MWNSPRTINDSGKRYEFADISALILPLDEMLDMAKFSSVANFAEERILQRLESGEFIYAIYEVLQALLEDGPFPENGHTGIQEAMVAELLNEAYGRICCEIELGDTGEYARKLVWNSVDKLLVFRYPNAPEMPWMIEEIGIPVSDFEPYRSPAFTLEIWKQLLTGDGGLFDEFLWDDDWRIEAPMDIAPEKAKALTEAMGLDLSTVQALAHTPSAAELQKAESYLIDLIKKVEHTFPFEGPQQ